jgi:hypothetical protein
MVAALRAVRVLLPWGVLTEPQGRAGRSGSLWEPFLFVDPISASSCKTL